MVVTVRCTVFKYASSGSVKLRPTISQVAASCQAGAPLLDKLQSVLWWEIVGEGNTSDLVPANYPISLLITQYRLTPDGSQLYPINISAIKGSGVAGEGESSWRIMNVRTLKKKAAGQRESLL